MSKLLRRELDDGTDYIFWCPGCACHHFFRVGADEGPTWQFDGDMEEPTFLPSLFVRGEEQCHLYLNNGRLTFLKDCSHDLAGKEVELPDMDRPCRSDA